LTVSGSAWAKKPKATHGHKTAAHAKKAAATKPKSATKPAVVAEPLRDDMPAPVSNPLAGPSEDAPRKPLVARAAPANPEP